MAIGWHFLYEGAWKIDATATGIKPFSAQGYLSHAQGPLRETFRGMVNDPDGLARLNVAELFPSWDRRAEEFRRRYGVSPEQWTQVEDKLAEMQALAREYLEGDDGSKPIDAHVEGDVPGHARQNRYRKELAAFRTAEANVEMSFEQERVNTTRTQLAGDRNMLIAPVKAWTAELDELLATLKPENEGVLAGAISPFRDRDLIDNVTMWGLAIGGACLLIGLFSRAAAAGSFLFLALIYLSWPPWPGVAPNPLETGHYLLINETLIEMLALLVLVFIPTGRWAGLDALLHRWAIGRQGRVDEDVERLRLAQVSATQAS